MRRAMALLGGVGLLAFGVSGPATAGDEPGAGAFRPPSPSVSAWWGFHVEVLVAGRPLEAEDRDGLRFVRAVAGADYELRITNPLPMRVAVALSVDGLNTIDARSTGVWDASKWIVHPYQPLTVSGW